MTNPISELSHDHRGLNELLMAIHAALSRVASAESRLEDELHEIRDGVEGFREALLEHFALEQEGLFPFVSDRLPAMAEQTTRLIEDHDRIAEALTDLVRKLGRAEADRHMTDWRSTLADFETIYASHTQSELAFLDRVASSLATDSEATEQLRSLLDHT